MDIVRTPAAAQAAARRLARPLGLVPTMGALHDGHLSLVRRALDDDAAVAASIFVNPLQFGPHEDFARYPRSFDDDAARLERAGVAMLYAPSVETMYPPGFSTRIDVGSLGEEAEGAYRPGHFTGVATVVAKLFAAVEPSTAYFGQKDAQQTAVIRRMAADLDLPIEIAVVPTVREPDGLALSSRNAYLTPEQRAAAPSLYRALVAMESALRAGGATIADIEAAGRALVDPRLEIEYLAIVDPASFVALERPQRPALVVGAVRAGSTRLIDNVIVTAVDGTDPLLTPRRRALVR